MEADGLLGAVVASESMGVRTLINGAGGCRSRAQIMIHELIPNYEYEDPELYSARFYSRQSRLPCTYLTNSDLVFGTGCKVEEGFRTVSDRAGGRTIVLDTLGASLLCTDYSGFRDCSDRSPILVDGDLSSMSFCEGYDTAMASIVDATVVCTDTDDSVNLLGYGIHDPGWSTGAAELRRLLEAMGLRVNAISGCGPDSGEAADLGRASLNILVRPEYSRRTAEALRRIGGADMLRPSMGAPIGYRATRSFIKDIAAATGKDPTRALEMVDREERAVRNVLMNFDRLPLGLHAKGFSVDGDSSTIYPLIMWMHEVFGMVPRTVEPTDWEYSEEIRKYVESRGFDAPTVCSEGDVEVVFTDGLSALRGNAEGSTTSYVEVRMPRGRSIDLIGRCTVGTVGCRYILDEMFNGIRRFRCGQPTELDYRPCGSV